MPVLLAIAIGLVWYSPHLHAQEPPSDTLQVDEPPVVVKSVAPAYPPSALAERAEGVTWLKVLVSKEGKPTAVEVLKSPREDFSEAAKAAALKFAFKPALLKHKPVAVWVSIPFKFSLKESEAKLEFPEGSLTTDLIAMALTNLGVHLQPFRYSLPYEHRITFTMEVYRNGKKEATHSGTFLQRANENTMVLTFRNDEGKLTVGISNANTSRRFPMVHLGQHMATLFQDLHEVHLAMNTMSAFYVFAANVDAIGSIKDGKPEDYIKKYPLVLVFSAELKPKEGK